MSASSQYWAQNAQYWAQNAQYSAQNTQYSAQNTQYSAPNTQYSAPGTFGVQIRTLNIRRAALMKKPRTTVGWIKVQIT